ncbi:MAG: hypothetical protein PHN38_04160 [Sulfurospirillaceae bacterium]|nr:hypothetical protein [Sulfurospirillaceae bacterium]
MKKIFFLFLLLSSFSFADYLFPSLGKCVIDYWTDQLDGTLKYVLSDSPTIIRSTTTKDYPQYIQVGWDYNASTGLCTREKLNNELGLQNGQFTFLMALTGLLCSFAFVFSMLSIFARRGGLK